MAHPSGSTRPASRTLPPTLACPAPQLCRVATALTHCPDFLSPRRTEHAQSDNDEDVLAGSTLLEHSFRRTLEIEEAGAERSFAKFGPWVGRRVVWEINSGVPTAGVVIGWKPAGRCPALWKAKLGDPGAILSRREYVDLEKQPLQAALSQAEADGGRGRDSVGTLVDGVAETEELNQLCEELDDLIEVTLGRTRWNQVVLTRSIGQVAGWWPAEMLSVGESRALCYLTPRLQESWKEGHVLLRYFDTHSSTDRTVRYQLGWARHDHLKGFDEVSRLECMPSKSNKQCATIIRTMERAAERVAELEALQVTSNQRVAGSSGPSSRPRMSQAGDQSSAPLRARRAAAIPARFRETQSPGQKKSKGKSVPQEEKTQIFARRGTVARAVKQQHQGPNKRHGAVDERMNDQKKARKDAKQSQQHLSGSEASIARAVLQRAMPDVWHEHSVDEKESLVRGVNKELRAVGGESVYTMTKFNKYLQNARYKLSTTGGGPSSTSALSQHQLTEQHRRANGEPETLSPTVIAHHAPYCANVLCNNLPCVALSPSRQKTTRGAEGTKLKFAQYRTGKR